MKKVINITLGGIVFVIEQDAFDILEVYLAQIRSRLTNNVDASEIIEDVERAIAEKFIVAKRNEKLAVTTSDVHSVMEKMGNPSDFGEVETDERKTDADTTVDTEDEPKKRLYRDTDDLVIAGVASGLARYFDIDPVIIRLIFVVSVFFNGLGILAYFIFWLVVPAAKTTAEKYAMRGEHVTLKDISERVRKNFESIDTIDIETAKGLWGTLRGVLNRLFKFLGQVMHYVVIAARYVIGFVLLVGGALATAGLVSMYSIVLFSDKAFFPAEAQTALDMMLGSSLGIIAISASFVMMLIPFLVLVLLGGGLLSKRNLFTLSKGISLAVVWIIAVVLAVTTSILQLQQVLPVIDPERFQDGEYEIHINIEDNSIEVDTTSTLPVEENVPSAPPSSEPKDLPISE